jgi:hypothetical protein
VPKGLTPEQQAQADFLRKMGFQPRPPILEQIADQSARASGDDDRIRFGQGLQPGGEVRRFADDIVLDDLASYDYEAGGDADPRVKPFG